MPGRGRGGCRYRGLCLDATRRRTDGIVTGEAAWGGTAACAETDPLMVGSVDVDLVRGCRGAGGMQPNTVDVDLVAERDCSMKCVGARAFQLFVQRGLSTTEASVKERRGDLASRCETYDPVYMIVTSDLCENTRHSEGTGGEWGVRRGWVRRV